MKDTKTLTEAAIMGSVFAILLLISIYVPFIGFLTFWALPLPFVVFAYRKGLKPSVILWIVACLLALLLGGVMTVPVAIIFGSVGIAVGEIYRRKSRSSSALIGASLFYVFHLLLSFVLFTVLVGQNPVELATEITKEQYESIGATLPGFGGDQSAEVIDAYFDIVPILAPLMIVGLSIVLGLVTVILSSLLLRRLGHDVELLPPFREWKFPKSFLWYYLIVMLLALFAVDEGSTLFTITWNLFPLLELLMAIQGLAFVFYYCHLKKISKAVPITLVVAVLLFSPLLYVVRIVGIIDLGFDLRSRIESQQNRR